MQRAAYAEDRPAPARLLLLALAAIGAGVAAGVLLAPRAPQAEPKPDPAHDASPNHAAAAQAEPQVAPRSIASEAMAHADAGAHDAATTEAEPTRIAGDAVPHVDAGAVKAASAASAAGAAPPKDDAVAERADPIGPPIVAAPEAPPSDASGLIPGRVAYLRCDGLATRRGRFPCPRDRQFERAVWQALRGLERCALLAPGPLELRVEISSAHAPSFELRAEERERERTARVCLGAALAGVATTLRPERMLVSFAFELRRDAR